MNNNIIIYMNWLAANTRQDLAIYALELTKRQKKAVIKDLREVNRVLKKVREKESKVVFTKIGEREGFVGTRDNHFPKVTIFSRV